MPHNFLTVPVSCVDSKWLDQTFIVRIKEILSGAIQDGGLIWLHVDAANEGNYLLRHIWFLADEINRPYQEIRINQPDPLLFWDDFVGTTDHCGLVQALRPGTIIGIYDGCYLPRLFIKNRQLTLTGICRAHKIILFIPIYHDESSNLNSSLEANGFFMVPRFNTAHQSDLQEMTRQLLHEGAPSLKFDICDKIVKLLLDGGPTSRTELQLWVDYYIEENQIDTLPIICPPPNVMRLHVNTPEVSTLEKIHTRFKESLTKLYEASESFFQWIGRPLISTTQPLVNPFLSRDPLHWFFGTVSYLSCLLFDSADIGLLLLANYQCGSQPEEILSTSPPRFYNLLRDLRTTMQHGLNTTKKRERQILHNVQSWYIECCSIPHPQNYHWRKLAACLLEEWEESVSTLKKCIKRIRESHLRPVIERQLAMSIRRLPRHLWYTVVKEILDEYGLDMNIDKILDKNYAKLQQKLLDSTVSDHILVVEAYRLATEVVLKEACQCPVDSSDLIQIGVPRGKLLGVFLKRINDLWQQNPGLTKKELLIAVLEDIFASLNFR